MRCRRITDTVPSSDQPYFVMIPEPDASKHSLSTSLESAKVEADDDLLFLQVAHPVAYSCGPLCTGQATVAVRALKFWSLCCWTGHC